MTISKERLNAVRDYFQSIANSEIGYSVGKSYIYYSCDRKEGQVVFAVVDTITGGIISANKWVRSSQFINEGNVLDDSYKEYKYPYLDTQEVENEQE